MKKFILQITKFTFLLVFIGLILLIIPDTPKIKKSPFYGVIQKDSLLENVQSPRIVFVGGSNLPFGLNSRLFKDSLNLNPVNTGITLNIGLKMMLDNTLPYIKPKDIVVISPEYQHFFGDFAFGSKSLLPYISANRYKNISKINYLQLKKIAPHIPKYLFKKLDPTEYFSYHISEYFNVNSFNEFGDIEKHWNLKQKYFSSQKAISDKFNPEVINLLKEFEKGVLSKKAKLYIAFPAYQESSFNNNQKFIKDVKDNLFSSNLEILSNPEKYKFHDSLFFDSPYHLKRSGILYRTELLIDDIITAQTNVQK